MRSHPPTPAVVAVGLALQAAVVADQPTDDARWTTTLERVSTSIVTLLVDHTRAFEDSSNMTTEGTGVVVDAERGLILTNRHIIGVGPVNATAVFLNQEEVELQPVWRDPVHDFGFFRYQPEDVKFIQPEALVLDPDAARVGLDIRVVGNDAGERLSILSGTIARLDREAPEYGRARYNDFNTFYIQAASGTSGGSSGSPVVDIEGRIVALNAAGRGDAATSLFLPVTRARRALDLIVRGLPVPRGTLQTTFQQTSFAELRRLGLSEATERRVRQTKQDGTGLLAVKESVPGSAADERLEPGDIVVAVNSIVGSSFPELADALDNHVGGSVVLAVERAGTAHEFTLPVDDLNRFVPSEYLSVGSALLHPLSYQQARHFPRSVDGVVVAWSGQFLNTGGIPRQSVITTVDGVDIHDLDGIEAAMLSVPYGADTTIRYIAMDDPLTPQTTTAKRPGRWWLERRCSRESDASLGETWRCRPLADPAERDKPPSPPTLPGTSAPGALEDAMVVVDFDMPFGIRGHDAGRYRGAGLIVDVERGWVVVDRSTVPDAIGDLSITFGGLLRVPGEVRYIHPLHNLAVVSYDPGDIGDTPVAEAQLSSEPLRSGQRLSFLGLDGELRIRRQPVEVASVGALSLKPDSSLTFRDYNIEVASLVNEPDFIWGGVLLNGDEVAALWAWWLGFDDSEPGSVPAELIADTLEHLRSGTTLRSLEVAWEYLPLVEARRRNMPEAWLDRYARNGTNRRLLAVARVVAGSPATGQLVAGDVLLAIDGISATSFREAERLTQLPEVRVEVLRDGAVVEVVVDTVALDGNGIDHVISWAGTLVEPPSRALSLDLGVAPEGVYSSWQWWGSPAVRYGLGRVLRIVRIGDQPTPDLDSFAAAVKGLRHRDAVRIHALNRFDVPVVHTLRVDQRDWPTYELRRVDGRWQRNLID
ncbi:MAG: hypothetical protein F4X98_18200 [Gammaproteobacteria bacterium]|nr:hypothetical protein [Gammaproteobacteria bacterium]